MACHRDRHNSHYCLPFRFGLPAEMGGAVSFLVSDEASYVTGETLVVAGGMHAKL